MSPDARHVQPLLALAAGLVDLRRFDEAAAVIRAADTQTLHGIPSQAVPAILRARVHLAMGCLCDAAAEGGAALATARALAAHSYSSVAHCVPRVIALRRGDLEAAAHHVASRSAGVPNFADAYARTEAAVAQAQVTEARDGPAGAIDQVREICAGLQAHRAMLLSEPATSAWLTRTALATGDQGLAARISRVMVPSPVTIPSFRRSPPLRLTARARSPRTGTSRPGGSTASRLVGAGVGRRGPRHPAGHAGRRGRGRSSTWARRSTDMGWRARPSTWPGSGAGSARQPSSPRKG